MGIRNSKLLIGIVAVSLFLGVFLVSMQGVSGDLSNSSININVNVRNKLGKDYFIAGGTDSHNELVIHLNNGNGNPVSDANISLKIRFLGNSFSLTGFRESESGKYVLDFTNLLSNRGKSIPSCLAGYWIGELDYEIIVEKNGVSKQIRGSVKVLDPSNEFRLPPKNWWLDISPPRNVSVNGNEYSAHMMRNSEGGLSWLIIGDDGKIPSKSVYKKAAEAAVSTYFLHVSPSRLEDIANLYDDIVWSSEYAEISADIRDAGGSALGYIGRTYVTGGSLVLKDVGMVFAKNMAEKIAAGHDPRNIKNLVRVTTQAELTKNADQLRAAAEILRSHQGIWPYTEARSLYENYYRGLVHGITNTQLLSATLPSSTILGQLKDIGISISEGAVPEADAATEIYEVVTDLQSVPSFKEAFKTGQKYHDKLQWLENSWSVNVEEIYNYAENPIEKGLSWLKDQQNSDGSWTYTGRTSAKNVGLSSMATLCFLNHGLAKTNPTVNKAINWILEKQKKDGSVTNKDIWTVYDTSLAILALVATGDDSYYDEIQAAVDYLLGKQNDDGGWGYDGHRERSDLSNSQWAFLGLFYAEKFNPHDDIVPGSVWSEVEPYVVSCQNNDGGIGYRVSNDSRASMTTAGLWGYITSGVPKSDSRVQEAIKWLEKNYHIDRNYPAGQSHYYYYLYSLAKACVLYDISTIGTHNWYEEMNQELLDRQRPDGHWQGGETDTVDTAWALMALETKQIPTGVELKLSLESPADLHVRDPEGRHVGKNYEKGKTEIEIPEASYSGPGSEPQIIRIPDPIAGKYMVKMVGTDKGKYTYTVQGLLKGEIMTEKSYEATISPGEVHRSASTVSSIAGPITVESNAFPVADAGGPYSGKEEESVTFDGTDSYDPDGKIENYEWDLDNDGAFDDAIGSNPTIVWDNEYSESIRLKVTDSDGATDVDEAEKPGTSLLIMITVGIVFLIIILIAVWPILQRLKGKKPEAETNVCPECGAEIPEGAEFCKNCGAKIEG